MKKLLTQEEIDALLANVSKAEPTQVDRALERMRLVQLYDFKHPERISKEQLRTLRTIHDNLARMLATYLSTTLRSLVDVNFSSIDQVTFNEYTMSLGVPNSLYIIDLKKLDGKAIIEISPQFALNPDEFTDKAASKALATQADLALGPNGESLSPRD